MRAIGIVDPAQWFALPSHVQELWLGHCANEWTGAYQAEAKKQRGPSMSADQERAAILARGERRR